VEAYPRGDGRAPGNGLPADPLVRTALAIGTADLSAALERIRPGDPASARARDRLLRYLIRMTTRPTPFGLFAGVGVVEWGDTTDAALAAEPFRTRARPDMGWLMDLVATLEGNREIRRQLRLFANPLAFAHGGWVFFTEAGDGAEAGAGRRVAARATRPVLKILERARTPASYRELVDHVLEDAGDDRVGAEALIDGLWRQSFLLTDLRPPLIGGAPARYVLDRLGELRGVGGVRDGLAALLEELERWDALPLAERPAAWSAVTARAAGLHRPARAGARQTVQVDAALVLTDRHVTRAVAEEAATAAELLLRLSPFPHGAPHLRAYRTRFEARYGTHAEVPLLELVDAEFGLGPPNAEDRRWRPQATAADVRRWRSLHDLAVDALRRRVGVVHLQPAHLDALETWTPASGGAPPSLDLPVSVAAASAAALDAGDFRLIVGPGPPETGGGRAIGRFADLVGADWRDAFAPPAGSHEDDSATELVYLPHLARPANIAIRPEAPGKIILAGTTPGVAWERVIRPGELLVGLTDRRFYMRSATDGSEVRVTESHMLDPRLAPPALGFLLDVERDRHVAFEPFDWGPAAAFPVLPRVQYGRIVLTPRRWLIEATSRLRTTRREFPEQLETWREAWGAGPRVVLADQDRRLLLDLDDAEHAELLREALTPPGARSAVVLQEELPAACDTWLAGGAGHHAAELVVTLGRTDRYAGGGRGPSPPPRAPAQRAPMGEPVRAPDTFLQPPGSDWLYLKLYCPPALQDRILVAEVGPVAGLAEALGHADDWFFIRYGDPDPHLRVRFHGNAASLIENLLPMVCEMAGGLVAHGSCHRFAFDTYEREVERYGGEAGTALAERVFAVDSRSVVEVLRLEPLLPGVDRMALTVLTVDSLLDALGADAAERLALYGDVSLSRADGRDYRQRRDLLRSMLLHGPGEQLGGTGLADVLGARRGALESLAHSIRGIGPADRGSLMASFAHMHCNRMLGTDPAAEQRVVQLARRTRESLRHVPENGAWS
jgi:thiopeptide-type bacteriocin biosynthesis protein